MFYVGLNLTYSEENVVKILLENQNSIAKLFQMNYY